MPTRKQRRRRERSFRHEYEFVLRDEDGNELPDEPRPERDTRTKSPARTAKQSGSKGAPNKRGQRQRTLRVVQPPTWQRAFKRGGLMGAGMFVLFVFVLKGGSQSSRAVTAGIYVVLFVPLTYWADRLAYRTFLKRSGQAPAPTQKR